MPRWDPSAQGDAGWLIARLGCLTASRMADALDRKRDGKPGAKRTRLTVDLVAERLAERAVDHVVTPEMKHGRFWENTARKAYEIETGNMVRTCGFALHDEIEFFGASPDGLIGKEGLIEIKCPTLRTHTAWMIGKVLPDDYKPQMLAQLAVTGHKWCDFVSFFPCDDDVMELDDVERSFYGKLTMPKSHRLRVWRFEPTPEELSAVCEEAKIFLAEVDAVFESVVMG